MDKHHYRFFVDPDSLTGEKFSSSDKELINQIKNVFRLKIGDKITVLDNSGYEFDVVLEKIDNTILNGKIVEKKKREESGLKINLFCSLLKKGNFELVLQKCTELGVFSITPVIYRNTVVKKTEGKERWGKIIKEASEQCGRTVLPVLNQPTDLGKVPSSVVGGLNLVADERLNIKIGDLQSRFKGSSVINLFVGPEGSFTDEERKLMKESGFLTFSLGNNILRSETAAIIGVGLLVNLL